MPNIKKLLNNIQIYNNQIDSNLGGTIEELTNGVETILTDHALIHHGRGISLYLYTSTLAFEGKVIYRFTGPTTKYAHIKGIQLSAENATIQATLKKGVTISVAGSDVSSTYLTNNNDNSTYTPESKLYTGSSYTGGSTWAGPIIVHGSSTNQIGSSSNFISNDYIEFVTKSSGTEYIIEIENIDEDEDTADNILLSMFFYEEDDGLSAGRDRTLLDSNGDTLIDKYSNTLLYASS